MTEPAVDRIAVAMIFDPEEKSSPTNEVEYKSTTSSVDAASIDRELDRRDLEPEPPPPDDRFDLLLEQYRVLSATFLGVEPRLDVDRDWVTFDEIQAQVNRLEFTARNGVVIPEALEFAGLPADATIEPPQAPKALTADEVSSRRQTIDSLKDALEGLNAEQIAIEVIMMIRLARAKLFIEGQASIQNIKDTLDLAELALDTKLWITGSSEARRQLGSASKRIQALRADISHR